MRRASLTRTPKRGHDWGTQMKVLATAVILFLGSLGGYGQTPTVSKTGSTRGLQAYTKFVDVKALGGTIRTRYYEAGQGEPMVLVHGGGFNGRYSANHWDRNVLGLGKRFHVFAPDKIAAGMTDNPPNDKDYNIQGETEHIYQFIQTMKLGKVHLVGQSRGAGLSLLLAVLHPEVVKTLVLVDSGTSAPDDACPDCYNESRSSCPTIDKDPEGLWRCATRALVVRPDVAFDEDYYATGKFMYSQPKAQTTLAKMKAGAGEPLGSQWPEYKKKLLQRLKNEVLLPMPTLLYWAVNDPQAPALKSGVALYAILAEKHPNVRLLITNKAGHFHFREYPEEFNQNVTNFIDYWNRQPPAATMAR
jgi:2-hydroxy-6-oxonona-2,4-dienedioate hydrolase